MVTEVLEVDHAITWLKVIIIYLLYTFVGYKGMFWYTCTLCNEHIKVIRLSIKNKFTFLKEEYTDFYHNENIPHTTVQMFPTYSEEASTVQISIYEFVLAVHELHINGIMWLKEEISI